MKEPNLKNNYLVIIAGPTAVGKTSTAIQVAKHFATVILSADSRQVFREMKIGTAVPSAAQIAEVPHYFIGTKSILENFNAGKFETEAVSLLGELYKNTSVVVMAGGSGLYIDAVCKGIDDFPPTDPEIRNTLLKKHKDEGVESLRRDLKLLDPVTYERIDLRNPKRIQKALEVTISTGRPYSSYLTSPGKNRPFRVIKIALDIDRKLLYGNINSRVLEMIENGLEQEARDLYRFRHVNALNTVGYKELFSYFDGEISLDEAIIAIQSNTRKYARRQLTWFRKDSSYTWFSPAEIDGIVTHIENQIKANPTSNGKQ